MSAAGRLRFDDEDENVSREAAETAAHEAENGVRTVERRVAKTASNPTSKRMQRQAIKKQYAAARAGRTAAGTVKAAEQAARATGKTAEKTAEGAKKAAQFLQRHKKGFAIAGALLLSLTFLLNVLSSCSVLVESVVASVSASTYPAGDADMLGAEAAYRALEAELQEYLDTYEDTHDYDEYRYDLVRR